MITANPVTYDARNSQTTLFAVAARFVAGLPPLGSATPAYPLPAADAATAAAGSQLREEPEYYVPDFLFNEDYEADPALIEAADANSEESRIAMASLDDAENLTAVLLGSLEQEGDSRAMQAEAVLKTVRAKLREAHVRIYRQDAQYRNLFMAYFEQQGRMEESTD